MEHQNNYINTHLNKSACCTLQLNCESNIILRFNSHYFSFTLINLIKKRSDNVSLCGYLDASLFLFLENKYEICLEFGSALDPVFRHGFSVDESNVLRWMCSCQSPHQCGCLLYFAVTDSSLGLGIYHPNKNFHRVLPSEQVSNMSATFVLTNWGKSITINRATKGDLKIG